MRSWGRMPRGEGGAATHVAGGEAEVEFKAAHSVGLVEVGTAGRGDSGDTHQAGDVDDSGVLAGRGGVLDGEGLSAGVGGEGGHLVEGPVVAGVGTELGDVAGRVASGSPRGNLRLVVAEGEEEVVLGVHAVDEEHVDSLPRGGVDGGAANTEVAADSLAGGRCRGKRRFSAGGAGVQDGHVGGATVLVGGHCGEFLGLGGEGGGAGGVTKNVGGEVVVGVAGLGGAVLDGEATSGELGGAAQDGVEANDATRGVGDGDVARARAAGAGGRGGGAEGEVDLIRATATVGHASEG